MNDASKVERNKEAAISPDVIPVIRARWSPRAFAATPISDREIEILFTAAAWAASSYNEQPWRYLVGRRGDAVHDALLDSLISFNRGWAQSAPVLFLAVAQSTFSANGSENGFALHDTGAAGATLALQATAMWLHSHSMAGFDQTRARASLGIPKEFLLGPVTALGAAGDPETLAEKLRAQEIAARSRKPLRSYVFSTWAKPLLGEE